MYYINPDRVSAILKVSLATRRLAAVDRLSWYYNFIPLITIIYMKKKKIVRKPPSEVHTFRCTIEEHGQLKQLAQKCGLSLSRYVVEAGLKHHPRQRLTPEECHALDSLMTARQDLVNVSNALNGKTEEEKLRMF